MKKNVKMSASKYLFSVSEPSESINVNDNFINIHKFSGKSFNTRLIFRCLLKDLTLRTT